MSNHTLRGILITMAVILACVVLTIVAVYAVAFVMLAPMMMQ